MTDIVGVIGPPKEKSNVPALDAFEFSSLCD